MVQQMRLLPLESKTALWNAETMGSALWPTCSAGIEWDLHQRVGAQSQLDIAISVRG